MRWRKRIYSGPRIGDLRIQKSFALFPLSIGGFKVWAETYFVVQKCFHLSGPLGARWVEEYRAFDQISCEDYLAAHYASHSHLKAKNLYRDLKEIEGTSPWYPSQPINE
jgi:hypothetical protein